jgi:hypothetical protein
VFTPIEATVSRTGELTVVLVVAAESAGVIPGIGAGDDTEVAPTAACAEDVDPAGLAADGRFDCAAMTAK